MAQVVGVRFERAGKIYYFKAYDIELSLGDNVIVQSSRGLDYGTVATPVQRIDPAELNQPLKPVLRRATEEDERSYAENKKLEPEAFDFCQKQILAANMPMKLIKAAYSFDGSKIVFYFSSDNRVDFRELVKILAAHFHTRIELRQVGVRDEARLVGGYSSCGRELCCASFLNGFHPVSIKMAKKQNLALNPAKISGVCGRLMCCLYYEYDKNAPDEPERNSGEAEGAPMPDCDDNCAACPNKPCPKLNRAYDLENAEAVADSGEMFAEEAAGADTPEKDGQAKRPNNRRRGRGGRHNGRGGKPRNKEQQPRQEGE